ncbi:MAG: hypothetical protein GXO22_02820 [Aquificae bacterium]|nr:hypothetical protein [Aquificota bacterium]
MKQKVLILIVLSIFVWHISYGFSIGNFFNPFYWASKAYKASTIIVEEMWKFKPSDIGKVINPFELGRDSVTRSVVLGMKLRRTMMEEDFGITDTMTLYGFKMYEAGANLMPGDYEDEVTAQMIKVILSNDEITKEFIKESLKYKGLSKLMLRVADRNPEILDKLVQMMSVDDSISYLLLKLALEDDQIGKLLFRKMNNTSFRVLIDSMYNSKQVSKAATELFAKLPDYVFSNDSTFKNYFFLPENSIYVEKMMYAVFKEEESIDNFEQFFLHIPQEWQFKMMNYIIEGIDPDGGYYPDEPYYFMHAVIKGIIKGKTLKHLLSKDLSNYQTLEPAMEKFMKTLITGAELYNEKEHEKLLKEFGKLGITSDEDEQEIQPDASIPPPRIESSQGDEKELFKIEKDELGIELEIKTKIKFFGFDYKGKSLYASGDKDKWLLLPYWLSTSTWILLGNKKEDREIPNNTQIGNIYLNTNSEYLVFILASQYAPCTVWALEQGFKPIYGEFIESQKQTGFVLLGKIFSTDERVLPLYGNGGGSFNYVIGIMKENKHPLYLFAKNKILQSSIDYQIKTNQLFKYAKFDPQDVFTIKPDDTKIKHQVERSAIPMFNDIFLKEKESFTMVDKINGSVLITDIEDFKQKHITYPPTEKQIFSVEYAQGTFVAVGEDKNIYFSKDGIDWKSKKAGKVLYDIAYGDGKFVAVGEDGYVFIFEPITEKLEKLDRKETGTKGKDLVEVEYINGSFFITGEDGIISVSSLLEEEEQIWDSYKVDMQKILNLKKEPNFSITKIAYIDKYYILTNNGIVLSSEDLENWEVGIQLDSMTPLLDMAYNSDREIFLAVGLNGVVTSSRDGKNWDDTKLLDCESIVGVIPKNEGFLLLGKNGKVIKFSPYYEDLQKISQSQKNLLNASNSSSSSGCTMNRNSKDTAPIIFILAFALIYFFRRNKAVI